MDNPFESEEIRGFRRSLAKFLAEEVWPHVDEWDEAGEFPWSIHEKAGEWGVSDWESMKSTEGWALTALEYVANEAMQTFGGAGYLRGNPVERVYRETKVMSIGGGSQEIMRDRAIRQMGL